MKELTSKNNFLQLEEKYSSLKNSKVVLLPLSFTIKKSEVHPAKLIFNASKKIEAYDEEMNRELCFDYGICSLDTLNVFSDSNRNSVIINKLSNLLSDKKLFSISNEINSLEFLTDFYKNHFQEFSILHLDAKARMKNISLNKNENEFIIRKLIEKNYDVIQVGTRALSKEEEIYKSQNLVKQFLACEINLGMFGNDWQEIVVRNLKQNVFIALNINVFEPFIFDNIAEPEPAGLSWNDIIYLLKIIGQDKNIIGLDLNGIATKKRSNSNYFLAKLIYKIMNYAMKNNLSR